MPEVSYVGLSVLVGKAMAAVERAVTESAEDLAGQQAAAAPVRTGTLAASIHVESVERAADSVAATNSTGGEADKYAIFVHEGTGAHIIEAKDGGFLNWPGAAHPVKKVHHPGTRPNPYMTGPLLANVDLYARAMAAAAAEEF
jgi:hypothetical protein